jgi:hypothetical protein
MELQARALNGLEKPLNKYFYHTIRSQIAENNIFTFTAVRTRNITK